jgi:hypothetical protein
MSDDLNDDLKYIRDRIPTYRGYGDEPARHDSDQRVRAILGESLSDARTRIPLDEQQAAAYDAVLYECMFGDQSFVRAFQHAKLDEATLTALTASDRALVELEERVNDASTADQLSALVAEIHERLARRRDPLHDTASSG